MKKMKGNKGVTLVELMIVTSIIGILVIALGFSYRNWMGSYKVESLIKEVYSDLMDARAKAMAGGGRMYFVSLTQTTYQVYEDTDEDGALDPALDTALPEYSTPKLLKYPSYQIRWTVPATTTISFDSRGLTSSAVAKTIYTVLPNGSVAGYDVTEPGGGYNPDYSCIVVSISRIRMGQTVHNNGVYQSCTEK